MYLTVVLLSTPVVHPECNEGSPASTFNNSGEYYVVMVTKEPSMCCVDESLKQARRIVTLMIRITKC